MPTRVKGCYPCSKRRISCDRTEPQCLKCTRANIECPGLGTRYRWAKPVQSGILKQRQRPNGESGFGRPFDEVAEPFKVDTTTKDDGTIAESVSFASDGSVTDDDYAITSGALMEPASRLSLVGTPASHPDQWAITYFVANISQWIYPTRSINNEFNTLLAPFASTSPEVFSAIAAASFHRLAYYGNEEFSIKAERYKSTAINGLLNNAQQISGIANSKQSQLTAVAVIIVMIYDDMIAAQNNFRHLIQIMKTLLKLVNFSLLEEDSLGRFLSEQIRLLVVICLPYFDINNEDQDMHEQALQFLDRFASRKDRHQNATFLAFCLQRSVSIWTRSMKEPGTNVDPLLEDFKSKLQTSDELADVDHYLTWVYFNCAVAASNPELSRFYADHLREHKRVIKFKNIPLMLQFLDRLRKDRESWPSKLQSHTAYICA